MRNSGYCLQYVWVKYERQSLNYQVKVNGVHLVADGWTVRSVFKFSQIDLVFQTFLLNSYLINLHDKEGTGKIS